MNDQKFESRMIDLFKYKHKNRTRLELRFAATSRKWEIVVNGIQLLFNMLPDKVDRHIMLE